MKTHTHSHKNHSSKGHHVFCKHDEIQTKFPIKEATGSRRLRKSDARVAFDAASSDFIRIKFLFDNLEKNDAVTDENKAFIKDVIIPNTKNYFESRLKVNRRT